MTDPVIPAELILHQYANSPFSEKLRLVFGFKHLRWIAVDIPVIMPKPDLVALTGGYRKTPVLQLGADVYCDTALAAKVIERLAPQPTLYPASAPLAEIVAQWADATLFWTCVPWATQPAGAAALFANATPDQLKAFAADRAPFTAGLKRLTVPEARVQVMRHAAALDAQLADGRPFLFGADASIADFAVAHCFWFIRRARTDALIEPFTALNTWLDRMLAFGHGEHRTISAADALAVAAAASAQGRFAPCAVEPGHGKGLDEAGVPVTVAATDYGTDPVAGTLVGLEAHEIVVRRTDPRAGTVHVHFPRAGFAVRLQQQDT